MVRVQLDFPDEQVREFESLMRETNIVTRKDLFNNALTLFQWAVKAKRAGRGIASIDEKSGTAKELLMPSLEHVALADKEQNEGNFSIVGQSSPRLNP